MISEQAFHFNHSYWMSYDQYSAPPMPIKHWENLIFEGSLTEHLRKITHNAIEHRLKFEGFAHPNLEECLPLSIKPNNRAWIREIEWIYKGHIWVYARVVIPEKTALIQNSLLTKIGNKSLGDFLFKDPNLQRSSFEICRIPSNHIYRQIADEENHLLSKALWARRSVFHFQHHPLLVIEIFKPEYFDFFDK